MEDEIREDRCSTLLRYIQDRMSEEERNRFQQKMYRDKSLRKDADFLLFQTIEGIEGKICPSRALLGIYFFGLEDMGELKQYISSHVKECEHCMAVIEEMEDFKESADQIAEEILGGIGPMQVSSLLELLKEAGKSYLDKPLLDSLFEQLQEFTPSRRKEAKFTPVGLGFSPDYEFTEEEKEFMEILNKLLPAEEKLDSLLEEGRKKEIREELLKRLQNESQVERIMGHLQ